MKDRRLRKHKHSFPGFHHLMEGTHRLVGIAMTHQPQTDHTIPHTKPWGWSPANKRAFEISPGRGLAETPDGTRQ